MIEVFDQAINFSECWYFWQESCLLGWCVLTTKKPEEKVASGFEQLLHVLFLTFNRVFEYYRCLVHKSFIRTRWPFWGHLVIQISTIIKAQQRNGWLTSRFYPIDIDQNWHREVALVLNDCLAYMQSCVFVLILSAIEWLLKSRFEPFDTAGCGQAVIQHISLGSHSIQLSNQSWLWDRKCFHIGSIICPSWQEEF